MSTPVLARLPGAVTRRRVLGVALAVACVAASPPPAALAKPGVGYSFAKAHQTASNQVPGKPSINASGQVAFFAPDGTANALWLYDGTTSAVVESNAGAFFQNFQLAPVINAAGQIAFRATLDSGDQGYFRHEPGVGGVTSIALVSDPLYERFDLFQLSMNASGTVAFVAFTSTGSGIYVGSGGAAALRVESRVPAIPPFVYFGGDPSINDAGTVVFNGSHAIDGVGTFAVASDGTVTAVGLTSGPFFHQMETQQPTINASGTVAIAAFLDQMVGGLNERALVTVAAGTMKTIATANATPFTAFGGPIVNASGDVAFLGVLDGGGLGLFVGGAKPAAKVVAVGDPLFGSTVTQLVMGTTGFNDAGLVAFSYALADGTKGVAIATPILPGSYAMKAADLTDSTKAGKDAVKVSGSFPKLGKTFDPRTVAASVTLGDAAAPVRIDIPANDPGWKGKNGNWTWKTAKGLSPAVTFSVKAPKGTFSVAVTSFDFVAPPPPAFLVGVSVGGQGGSETATFGDRGKGRFRFRR